MKHTSSDLIRRIMQKDERALMEVYGLYHKKLHHFVFRQLRNREEAEEIVQDVFIEFIESLRNYRGESSLQTFIFAIAKFKVIDAIRKKKVKRILFSAMPDYVVEGLRTVVMDDELDRRELTRRMNAVFAQLPHDYQVVLRLKYMEQRKVQDIARTLRLSFKAAESLIFRARRAFITLYRQTL